MKLVGADWVITKDIELAKHVFERRDNYPLCTGFREAFAYEMGVSMFTSEVCRPPSPNPTKSIADCLIKGDLWKEKHHLLQPMLRQKMLERHVVVVYEKANNLIAKLKGSSSSSPSIEMLSFIKKLTMDVIGEVAFGNLPSLLFSSSRLFSFLLFSSLSLKQ